jgi:hypothetical protein
MLWEAKTTPARANQSADPFFGYARGRSPSSTVAASTILPSLSSASFSLRLSAIRRTAHRLTCTSELPPRVHQDRDPSSGSNPFGRCGGSSALAALQRGHRASAPPKVHACGRSMELVRMGLAGPAGILAEEATYQAASSSRRPSRLRYVRFCTFAAEPNRLLCVVIWGQKPGTSTLVRKSLSRSRSSRSTAQDGKDNFRCRLGGRAREVAADLKDQVGERKPPVNRPDALNSGHGVTPSGPADC